MALPDDSTNDDLAGELDQLTIEVGLQILFERAVAGDKEARRDLQNINADLSSFLEETGPGDQGHEGSNA